jgi:hypothetical protein
MPTVTSENKAQFDRDFMEKKSGKKHSKPSCPKCKKNGLRTFYTEDGYKFHELPDGRVSDSHNKNSEDMSWDSVKEFMEDNESAESVK